MSIFEFFDFPRSNKQVQTWDRVEPAKAFDSDEVPEVSVRSHLVSPVIKAGPKSRLFIKPFGNAFKRGSTYVTDGKAFGLDLLDGMTPEQVEARRRRFARVFSKIASIRDARSEGGE